MTLALFAAAGRGSRLVGRPRSISGVAHVYTGPLTTSGRFVPLRGRPACGARTRRLSVLEFPKALETGTDGTLRRVCERCRSCLLSGGRQGRPPTRDELVATYGHLTAAQLAAHARAASTRDEIDLVGTLELLVVDAAAARRPLAAGPSLHDEVVRRRRRIRTLTRTEAEHDAIERAHAKDAGNRDAAARRRQADWQELQADRDRRRTPTPRELDERLREREEIRRAG